MRAFKKLSHRDWLTLRDLWIAHLPDIDLNAKYPEPTLWQLQAIQLPPLNASGMAEFPYVDGVREAIFREAVLLTRKFIYCGTLLPTLSGIGKNTWTAIAAYEASFYGAKAFCYLLGFASLERSSEIYLDAFHETERKIGKQKKKFYETLRAHDLRTQLTHKMLWGLTERLINTTSFEGELLGLQIQLKLTDWEKFSSFRNRVLYDGGFWPLQQDVAMCDLAGGIQSSDMVGAAQLDLQTSPLFAGEYFVVATLFRDIIKGMLQTIAEVAPAVSPEVQAFEVISKS